MLQNKLIVIRFAEKVQFTSLSVHIKADVISMI